MKHYTLLLVLYQVVWICGETVLKPPDEVDTEEISKENSNGTVKHEEFTDAIEKFQSSIKVQEFPGNVERRPRSPLPFDSFAQLRYSERLYPEREHYPMHPYGQDDFPIAQGLPIQTSDSSPFPYQGLPTSHHGLDPRLLLNIEEYLAHYSKKRTFPTSLNHDHPDFTLPIRFYREPESRLEPPLSHMQEDWLGYDHSLPPTLHRYPHDVFPYSGQTYLSKGSAIQPDELFYEEQFFQNKDPGAHSKEHVYHSEPSPSIYPEEHVQELVVHQDHQIHPEVPELSITFEGYNDGESSQNCHGSNCDIQKDTKINNDKSIEKKINFGPTEIFISNVDKECLGGGSSVCDKKQSSGEHHLGENCGKITSKASRCEPQMSFKKETSNRKICNECFDHSKGSKALSRNNSNRKPCDIRNFLSEQQFNELRVLLRNIARNHGSKCESFLEDVRKNQPLKCQEDFSCSSKCLNKLCTLLHLAKQLGYFITEKSQLALNGLRGLKTEFKCDTDHLQERRTVS